MPHLVPGVRRPRRARDGTPPRPDRAQRDTWAESLVRQLTVLDGAGVDGAVIRPFAGSGDARHYAG
ncbi:hypothetical protein [Actinoallomurus iriomotensis]|uniref:hypothetical protein n=1 Tax=Actinoallomurus iriomotensis TaxID=478107 RepID=UPI002553075A|nr:hypothetical protein [Actinoallomurus iriomotensis]